MPMIRLIGNIIVAITGGLIFVVAMAGVGLVFLYGMGVVLVRRSLGLSGTGLAPASKEEFDSTAYSDLQGGT